MEVSWPGRLTARSAASGPAQDGRGPDQMSRRDQLDAPQTPWTPEALPRAHHGLRVLM
jgi:hypothetical protein